jgi:IS5 family transposase
MASFLMCEAENRVKSNKLLKLEKLITWEEIGTLLNNLGRSGMGPSGYPPLKLLKALILQAWHSLSDSELEESLRARMDFMLFTNIEGDVPDSTTICRFRNLLISKGLLEKIFKLINQQLEKSNLKVTPIKGAILDATIIESAGIPDKTIETIPVDRDEEKTVYKTTDFRYSGDKDARWLKKGNKNYFGYKAFVTVGFEEGYIEKVSVTPANVSECKYFKEAIEGVETERYYTDKGIKRGIMYTASKNKPLTHWQKTFNKLVSKVRYKVEQGFGTLKRRFKFTRASYFGIEKVYGQFLLKAMAFNLLKAVNSC